MESGGLAGIGARGAAVLLIAVIGLLSSIAWAQESGPEDEAYLLSADEIRGLVAPVALYPDELLAIVLPAATNPLQLVQANRYLEKRQADSNLEPDPNWDPAILALINYPQVIDQMNADLDWTEQLGNAVIDQQVDVLDSIQQIRAEAAATGYLQTDDNQVVVQEGETVIIQSAQPQVIYVPAYDPQVVVEQSYATYPPPVYSTPYPSYYAPGATFFAGAVTGAVFAYGFDWDDDDIDIDFDGDDFDFDGDGTNFNRDVNIENSGDININSGNTASKSANASRFSAETQAGQGKMTWSSEKAKKKSTTSKQTRKKTAPKGVAPAGQPKVAKAKPSQSTKLQTNRAGDATQKTKPSKNLGDYQTGKTTAKQSDRGNKSLNQSAGALGKKPTSGSLGKPQKKSQAAGALGKKQSAKPNSTSAFAGAGSKQKVGAQSNRGNKSMKSSNLPRRSSRK